MKTKLIFTTILIISLMLKLNAQDIKSGKKTIKFNNAPQLVIKNISLVDENNDQVADAEENCFLKLTVKHRKKPCKNSKHQNKNYWWYYRCTIF